jgi:hypothetical protein
MTLVNDLTVEEVEDALDQTPLILIEAKHSPTAPVESHGYDILGLGGSATPSIYVSLLGLSRSEVAVLPQSQLIFFAGHSGCRQMPRIHNLCVPVRSKTDHFADYWLLTRPTLRGEAENDPPSVHPSVRSVRDIANWLDITQTKAIEISGIRDRTFYHWRSNPEVQPRRQDTERLSRLHAVVELLIVEYGEDATQDWFKRGTPSRLERVSIPRDDELVDVEHEAFALIGETVGGVIDRLAASDRWPSLLGRESDESLAAEFANREVSVGEPLKKLILPESDQRE